MKHKKNEITLLGSLISIISFIWYIKVHNIPSSLLSLTSLSSHLKHLIILIFVKLAQFSQYMHCNPFLHHAMLAPFQSYLNFLETLDCLWNWFLIFCFCTSKYDFSLKYYGMNIRASNIHKMNAWKTNNVATLTCWFSCFICVRVTKLNFFWITPKKS